MLHNPNRLEQIEYIFWVCSAIGSIAAGVSGQVIYVSIPLSFSILLNLINRRYFDRLTRRRATHAIDRVQQQLSREIQALQQQLPVLPPSDASRSQNRLNLASAALPDRADDWQWIEQEIAQLQERCTSLQESLTHVIDYLNDLPMAAKVDRLERAIADLSERLAVVQRRVEALAMREGGTPAATAVPAPAPSPPPTEDPSAQTPAVPASNPTELPPSETRDRPPAPGKSTVAVALPTFVSPPAPKPWRCTATLSDHQDWVSELAIAPDGQTLVSCSFDTTIRLWRLPSGEAIQRLGEHSSPVYAIAIDPDSRWLASGSWDETVELWDLEDCKDIDTLKSRAGSARSLAFSPDGKTLASGWFDQTIKLWQIDSDGRSRSDRLPDRTLTDHLGSVDAIAYHPNGTLLASGSADGTVKLWSLDSESDRRSPIRTLTDTAAPITCIAFSADGKLLASGGRDRTIKLWYVEAGQLAKTLTGHTGSVMSLAFDPDGLLVSGSTDGTVKVWHPESGKTVNTLVEDADAIISVALDATGQILVSGSASGTIKVWQFA